MISKRTFAAAALFGGLVVAGPALAITAYSTAHLNLRAGPGFQYPVIGVLNYDVRAQLNGCIADFSWCSLTVAGLTGWSSSEYLVTDATGAVVQIAGNGVQLSIPVIAPAGVTEIVATTPVGTVTAVAGPLVEAIAPPPEVITYVTQQAVAPILVNGEVVIGATLSAEVPLYAIPSSPYQYTVINGQRVLVDPAARRIVYIYR